jgi:hypothetical protein
MGRACSMNDRDEKCTQSISQETWTEKDS